MATTNSSNSEDEISPEVSKRICDHMNNDHAISAYAMAKMSLKSSSDKKMKISNAKMKSVSLSGYDLSFVLCSGDVCEMRDVSVPFDAPIKSQKDVRSRIIEEHSNAFSPQITELLTDPISLTILILVLILGYATLCMNEDEIVDFVSQTPTVFQTMVDKLFCCRYTFANTVKKFFYFTVGAHVLEALYVGYICQTSLKLSKKVTLMWMFFVSCVGYTMTSKVLHFDAMDKKLKRKKVEKKTD